MKATLRRGRLEESPHSIVVEHVLRRRELDQRLGIVLRCAAHAHKGMIALYILALLGLCSVFASFQS